MATTQVDAVLKVTGEDGTSRPLSTEDFQTARTGAATELTLAAVLAALGDKLSPADIATLATAAKQDAAKNVLDAISGALGAPAVDTVKSLLATIAANTGTETTTVSHLSLTADQVQLNTDTLEALLGTLNSAARPTNLPGASGLVIADTTLMGFSVREAAGTPAAAAMRLRAGTATGTILATVTLSAGESVRDWFGPSGIQAAGGVYLELLSGTITGGVQTR
jgi:DNA uptake protein ComE-like DNA-binding protein